jgi:crotonobetainyl-CoA:carnitine CoA-transferase CaiB-like acyl-CoA transferase
VAIAVETDAHWRALCQTLGRPELDSDPRFGTAALRRANEDALEAIIAAATVSRDPHAIADDLQARGVPAYAVQNSPDLLRDPQLRARGHFHQLAHPDHGSTTVEGSRFALSRTPAAIDGPAPTYGADNDHVLRTILGYDDTKITMLVAAGALA